MQARTQESPSAVDGVMPAEDFRPCTHCPEHPPGDCPYCRGSGDQDYADEFIADIVKSYLPERGEPSP